MLALYLLAAFPAAGAGGDTTWTLAGTGVAADSGDGGQAREAEINQPRSVFATPGGGYVWAEPWSNRVRIVDSNGIVTTLAGTGASGFGGDGGQATAATLRFVHSAAPTADGGYLLADTQNNRIRKVSSSGVITTVAGTGTAGYTGDGGAATAARINNPRGVVALASGGFLFPDTNNHRVRMVSAGGVITTVAGTGVQGFTGDGGAATAARLSIPFGVAPTPDGGFLIVDVGNQRIRKVASDGTIATVAGTGVGGYSGDGGPATAAQLNSPHNLAVEPDGAFLIADASNERVRRVAADGTISTLIGDGSRGYTGDGGPASAARTSVPKAVAVTPAGDVLIAEEQNNRIRFVGTVVAPLGTTAPTVTGLAQEGQLLTASAGGWSGTGPQIGYQWQRCAPACADIAGAAAKSYALVAADVGKTLRVRVTGSNVAGSADAYSAETGVVASSAVPPSNTSLPTVSGSAQVGQTLSATTGTWSGSSPISYAYQWRRCNGSGGGCTDISGATGQTYVVVVGDVGSTLRVAVTASNPAGQATAVSAATSPVAPAPTDITFVASATQPFSSSSAFTVPLPGSAVAGDVLLASVATDTTHAIAAAPAGWTQLGTTQADGTDSSLSVFWRVVQTGDAGWAGGFTGPRAGVVGVVAYRGADGTTPVELFGQRSVGYSITSPTVEITPAGNRRLLVSLHGADPGSASRSGSPDATPAATERLDVTNGTLGYVYAQEHLQLSAAPISLDATWNGSESSANFIVALTTAPGTPTAPVNTSPPTVTGTPQQGQTLSASPGTWTGTAPITYTYRWQRCSPACADIGGATSSSYLVAAADVGATLRVGVTGTNSVGSSEGFSAETATVTSGGGGGTLTVNLAAGGDDGDVGVAGPQAGGYPPAASPAANSSGSVFTAGRRLAFGEFQVLTALLRFDTSALPDNATVTSVKLRAHVTNKADANDRDLVGEWYAASSWPIDAADWALTVGTSALPGTDIGGLTKNTTAELTLSNPGNVSLTGFTGLRLGISGDQPAGDNLVQFATLEHTTKPEPSLVITYTTP